MPPYMPTTVLDRLARVMPGPPVSFVAGSPNFSGNLQCSATHYLAVWRLRIGGRTNDPSRRAHCGPNFTPALPIGPQPAVLVCQRRLLRSMYSASRFTRRRRAHPQRRRRQLLFRDYHTRLCAWRRSRAVDAHADGGACSPNHRGLHSTLLPRGFLYTTIQIGEVPRVGLSAFVRDTRLPVGRLMEGGLYGN